jgi:RNA polymerase sigma factor (sigma-70 family)
MGVDGVTVPESSLDEAVYRRHAPRLMGLAAALVGASDADDVVAAALARVLASAGWPAVENAEAYLTRAVVNEARSWSRSALRRTARDARWARGQVGADRELGDPELAAALLRLPVRQRAVVFLTYWADLAPGAIADQLEISEGSVRKHLARARSTLRKELA